MEAAGISTVALSMVPALTAAAGAPRVAPIEFPFGRPLGQPGEPATQRAVLQAILEVLRYAATPGTVVELPFQWPEPPERVQGTRGSPHRSAGCSLATLGCATVSSPETFQPPRRAGRRRARRSEPIHGTGAPP